MPYKNQAGETKSDVQVLKAYFGQKPEQTLSEFLDETKALTPESKKELCEGAAKELGWTSI